MTCGSCGAPIAEGIVRCPFCGASAKYAITESGTLPYEYAPEVPPQKGLEPPRPRWDLEKPEGTSYSYYKTMRATYERWAALERRRLVGKGPLGCTLTGVLFVLFVGSCALFSLASSQARMQNGTATLSASDITATATANPNPYMPGQGLLALDNYLNENSNAAWANYSSDSRPINQGCTFQNGSYETSKPAQKTPTIRYCLANSTNFRNFTYQIEMSNTQGNCGGIIFRENTPGDHYYFFICANGRYGLWLGREAQEKLLIQGRSGAIVQGDNQLNLLAVVANRQTIELYTNRVPLATVYDMTYTAGKIGTAVGAPDNVATDYEFNNAEVWTL